ncbi:hypothetical protein VTN77DRAFT_336 [Rasamsonia byssochlamydoides]|uniref:uncharacterized protein n=1 Tax=Rasamsonia byssochlamydoides TaxID=89139 RepID=UPI003743F8E5
MPVVITTPFRTEKVTGRAAECQFYSPACTHDRIFASYSQRPLLPDFAAPAYSNHWILRVQGRQLLPTSGDDFWYGGSGGVQLGGKQASDKGYASR